MNNLQIEMFITKTNKIIYTHSNGACIMYVLVLMLLRQFMPHLNDNNDNSQFKH